MVEWKIALELVRGKELGLLRPPLPFPLEMRELFSSLQIFEPWRPDVLRWQKHGARVFHDMAEAAPVSEVIVVPTRSRVESLALIAQALRWAGTEGRVHFVCANGAGARGYLAHLSKLLRPFEAESKSKCRYFSFGLADVQDHRVLSEWESAGAALETEGLWSAAGVYGHGKIDAGSKLLVEHLPELRGVGADLGAGVGYLSKMLLGKGPALAIHLLEADARALLCAERNLAAYPTARFHWCDVLQETPVAEKSLDWVIMNPPFHEGDQQARSLGESFIRRAARLLRAGGELVMVANSFLAYEDVLAEEFTQVSRLAQADGFKVLHAQR